MAEEWEEWDPNKTTFLQHMIAGSIAGLAEHTLMFPIDTLKTHVQCERCGSPNPWSTWRCGKRIVMREGAFRLWRGVTTVFIGCVPAHAAYFSIYEAIKANATSERGLPHAVGAALAGASATLAHDCIMTPVDVAKQRLQLGYYRGVIDCLRTVYAVEGARGFFASLPTTLVMNLPYGGVTVAVNESMKRVFNPSGEYNFWAFILSASVAGVVASALTTPLDLVKTRLQTSAVGEEVADADLRMRSHVQYGRGGPLVYTVAPQACEGPLSLARAKMTMSTAKQNVRGSKGLLDVLREVYAEGGIKGLFRGAIPRMCVHGPSAAISWTTYETVKALLVRNAS